MTSPVEQRNIPQRQEINVFQKKVIDELRTLDYIPRFPVLRRNPDDFTVTYDLVPAIPIKRLIDVPGHKVDLFVDFNGIFMSNVEAHRKPHDVVSRDYITGRKKRISDTEYTFYWRAAMEKIKTERDRQREEFKKGKPRSDH